MSVSGQNDPIGTAGLLLTGGSSRRMGRPKAAIGSGRDGDGPELARITAAILAGTTGPVLEVGPGHSGLPHVMEEPPGSGPLMAVAAGARELRRSGWTGPAVVLATDLAMLQPRLVEWLVSHTDPRSVVPVVDGRPQPLCARYDTRALDMSVTIASEGARSMRDLLGVIDHLLAGPDEWAHAGIDERWFADIDTPGELEAYRKQVS